MSRPHFSLGTLLLMVLSAGVAFAALKSPSELWASALFTTAVAVLLVAVLWAVHRRDRSRAYWLGFALFGWVYLILSLVPETAPRLATTGLLDALFARVHGHGHAGRVISVAFSPQGDRLVTQGGGFTTRPGLGRLDGQAAEFVASADPEGFRRVGHSLLALLIASSAAGCRATSMRHAIGSPRGRPREVTRSGLQPLWLGPRRTRRRPGAMRQAHPRSPVPRSEQR